jgi:hypothetical protein
VLFSAPGHSWPEVHNVWMILGVVASQSGFTLPLSLPTWGEGGGVDVDGLGCPLHRPMARSCQAKGHGLYASRCPVLSLQVVAPFRGCEASRV